MAIEKPNRTGAITTEVVVVGGVSAGDVEVELDVEATTTITTGRTNGTAAATIIITTNVGTTILKTAKTIASNDTEQGRKQ